MSGNARPSLLAICEEVTTMAAGLTAALMPLFLLSMPALLPLAVFTGAVLAIAGLAGAVLLAVLGVPLLLGRMIYARVARLRSSADG